MSGADKLVRKEHIPDYYLTTISENAEKAWIHCAARDPRFSAKIAQICAKPTKPLQIQGSSFYGLITPTLKAAGSNPVGRTKKGDMLQHVAFCW